MTWMLQCVSPYLTIDQHAFEDWSAQYKRFLDRVRYNCTNHHTTWADTVKSYLPTIPLINPAPNPLAEPRQGPAHRHDNFDYGWGTGPIVDSYIGMYKLAGAVPRVPGDCRPEGSSKGETNEYIHPICEYRKIVRGSEDDSALKAHTRTYEKRNGKGRFWWYMTDTQGHEKALPEWVILEHNHVEGTKELNFERAWYEMCEKTDKAKAALKAARYEKDFLDTLDDFNAFEVGDQPAWMYP